MTTWTRHAYDNFLTHVVCAELEPLIVAELHARGARPLTIPEGYDLQASGPVTEWCIDLGGWANTHQPVETFALDGLSLTIPSHHVEAVADELAKLERRWFPGDVGYRKTKAWSGALVVTPAQSTTLLTKVTARVPVAVARAEAFAAAMRRAGVNGVS